MKLPSTGRMRKPAARIVAINLDFLAAFEFVGGIVVLPRSAANVDVVAQGGRLGKGRFAPRLLRRRA